MLNTHLQTTIIFAKLNEEARLKASTIACLVSLSRIQYTSSAWYRYAFEAQFKSIHKIFER